MKKAAFIAGAVVLLLLFGCTSTNGGTVSPPAQQPSGATQSGAVQVANGIGDADINVVQVTNDSDLLPTTEPVEADSGVIENATAAPVSGTTVSGTSTAASGSDLDSYVDVTQVNDSDVMPSTEPVEADTG